MNCRCGEVLLESEGYDGVWPDGNYYGYRYCALRRWFNFWKHTEPKEI